MTNFPYKKIHLRLKRASNATNYKIDAGNLFNAGVYIATALDSVNVIVFTEKRIPASLFMFTKRSAVYLIVLHSTMFSDCAISLGRVTLMDAMHFSPWVLQ